MATSHHIYFRIVAYVITIVMHITNTVIMFSSFHGEPMKNAYVQHFSEMQIYFFTCWTFAFQILYALVAGYGDFLTLKNTNNKSFYLCKPYTMTRDGIFIIFVWPSTVATFTLFWSFFFYDRSLVFPEEVDLVITNTSNHIMHTCILPVLLWEIMFRKREALSAEAHVVHMFGVWCVEALYIYVLLTIHAFKGVWVYPIFSVLGGMYFHVFFIMLALYLALIYCAHWGLNYVVWDTQEFVKKEN